MIPQRRKRVPTAMRGHDGEPRGMNLPSGCSQTDSGIPEEESRFFRFFDDASEEEEIDGEG